jgi:sporulation protein YlmC with PRC-barrel domain/gas vesicle protein
MGDHMQHTLHIPAAACAALTFTCALLAQEPASKPMPGAPDYCSLSKLIGATVRMHPGAEARREAEKDGETAKKPEGKIQDVIVDCHDGSLQYAVVSWGGFIGIGDKTVAVPVSALTWIPAHERFELAASEDRLRALPAFDLSQARKTGLDAAYDTLQTQWRTTGVADASGTTGDVRDASGSKLEREAKEAGREIKEAGREVKEEVKEAGREIKDEAREIKRDVTGEARTLEGTKFYLVPARYMCASEIDDHNVYAGNEKLGSISDVLVDRSKRSVPLVVVKRGGALGMGGTEYLVPFRALHQCTSGDERVHCVKADVHKLDAAVVYEKPKSGIVEAEAARRALENDTFGRVERTDRKNDGR